MAGGLGFEPRLAESEFAVLPLDDPPTRDRARATDSIGRPPLKDGGPWGSIAWRRPQAPLSWDLHVAMPVPRSDASPSDDERHDVCAALDLGTNNCRLLIARRRGEGFHVIDAFSRIVRLGEGLAATGCLSEPAMARTLAALRVCAGKVARSGARRARYVATEACRRAANCAEFLERVRRDTGIRDRDHLERRGGAARGRRLRAAARSRACPARWCSTSAAARPSSSGSTVPANRARRSAISSRCRTAS